MVVATANLAIFAIERWVVLPLHVPGASMQPALRSGDRILVRHRAGSVADLKRRVDRGDVLVFRSPGRQHPLVVKRVIGLPGETIQAVDGLIAIDNERTLQERWLPDSERERGTRAARSVDIPLTRLGDDELYMLGDNRDRSIDSREYGPIQLADVVGSVTLRVWPIDRFGTVDQS